MRPKSVLMIKVITMFMILGLLQSCLHAAVFSDEQAPDFNMLFERHGAIMMMIEPESGKILYVNNAALDFYGYEPDTFTTLNIDDINKLSSDEIALEMKSAIDEKLN